MRKVRPRTYRSVAKHSAGPAEAQARNCLIDGDNLQAMATLYKERGQVDLILTDPPYNTGNDFRYNDRWEDDPNDDGEGEFISPDDPGRHTKWMRFMWPRLQMMRAMLKQTGVLAICIDHRELFRLGQMLDELFGEENRVAIINWQRAASRRNDKKAGSGGVSTSTEYVLVYARDRARVQTGLEVRASSDAYTDRDGDPEGAWSGVSAFAPGAATHRGMVYAVQSPFTGVLHYPPGEQCWKNDKAWIKAQLEHWGSKYEERDLDDGKVPALLLKGAKDPRDFEDPLGDPAVKRAARKAEKLLDDVLPELFFNSRGKGRPRKKAYLSRIKQGVVPTTYWANEDYETPMTLDATSWASAESGTSEVGARELNAIVGSGHGFETVKPLKLFMKVIQLWCPPDGLVFDPFAGSGTAGHAVLAMNAEAGTDRRFIVVEQGRPDKGDPYAHSLTADRLRRAVTGEWDSGKGEALGGGFKYVKLGSKVDAKVLLQMERDDMAEAMLASYFDVNRRRQPNLVSVDRDAYKYLVGKNADGEGFYLVWSGPGGDIDFDEDIYEEVADEAAEAGLKPYYHVYARLNLYPTENVTFYPIPDRILMDFGLDMRTEAYSDELVAGGTE